MRFGLIGRLAAARLHRAGAIVKKSFASCEPAGPGKPGGSTGHGPAPLGVWYGRTVFCMHYPLPHPLPDADDDRIASRATGSTQVSREQ